MVRANAQTRPDAGVMESMKAFRIVSLLLPLLAAGFVSPLTLAAEGDDSTTVPPPVAAPAPERCAVGLGYPDVRLRVALIDGIDVEAKFAFEQGIQVYSGRLYWNFWNLGPLIVVVGAEEGYARFDGGYGSVNGDGSFTEGFLGLEYPFAKRLRLSVDAGPARIQATSEGYTYTSTQLIYNTALYIYLF